MAVVDRVVGSINRILGEDRTKWWSVPQLVSAVSADINQTNLNPIKRAINVLITANAVEVRTTGFRRSAAKMLRYKDTSGPGHVPTTPNVVNADPALRAENESLKKSLAEAARIAAEASRAVHVARIDRVVEVQLKDTDGELVKSTKGLFHTKFQKLVKLAEARRHIFIYGPTGCGKSHICHQLADSLDLDFAFISCSSGMSEGHITGRLLPVGDAGKFEYVESEFVRLYENGGVFLLDELDAADANVLLVVNSALANGKMAIGNRPEKPYAKKHPDFICIAAANTVGTGANRLYSGRNKLDAATLDRFAIGKVYMDYDAEVEAILCPDDVLRNRLLEYRKAINAHGLERAMSTRFMADAYKMTSEYGWTMVDVNEAFFSGWREDELNKVRSSVGAI